MRQKTPAEPAALGEDRSADAVAPLDDVDDETLALALIAGDSVAPPAAWRRFAPMVHRLLKRTFGPGNDVDDVHQDVFVAFFRKVPSLREPKSLRAFVVSITVRTIKHELRRRRARRFIALWGTVSDLAGETAETDNREVAPADIAARQALASFYAILSRLSAPDRTAFSLRYLEGMDLLTLAGALGVSVSTVKRQLARIWLRVAARVRTDPALAAYSFHIQSDVTPEPWRKRA